MSEANRGDDASADEALIIRWKQGDDRAAAALVQRHATALARFASQLGEREDIEELVQDTFVRAFAALDGFRSESSLRTWLFTIERRLIADRRRGRTRRAYEVEVNEQDASTAFDALDALVADETSRRVSTAMKKLTPMQRQVFTLRVQEGRSYRDIAAILGSTEGAARVHYHNAMRAVKEQLDD